MTQGLSNRDIAELLGISRPTLHGGRAWSTSWPSWASRPARRSRRSRESRSPARRPVPAPGGCSELGACRSAGGPARRSAGWQSGRLSRLS
ncbi:hypothetical protein [Streptomyces sp. NBC_00118]|uniref:hypothetical protein n=1 Tax=unclassified Streptomyces TaxID=2593676 RepID=UPI0032516037